MGLPRAGPGGLEGAHRQALKARLRAGHALFFPAAAAYALAVLPASVAALLGLAPAIPGLAFGAGHAHELLFGFALAVVAGNQLGPTPAARLAALFAAWLAARIAFLAAPLSIAALAANAAFAALLAAQLAPRLAGAAKKWRNRALPVVIAALCAAAVAIHFALRAQPVLAPRTVLLAAILLLALLMLFMGGRIIAPAAAGQAYRQGGDLAARVQPRIEGGLIVAGLAAVLATLSGLPSVAGAAAIAAALLALARMARWRLWKLRGRPDLGCLAAGYGWLVAGLAAVGAAMIAGRGIVPALHVITVGAMGTLTINVMALTWMRLARRDPAHARLPVWATGLIALATLLRVGADGGFAEPRSLLLGATLAWSLAYGLLLLLFVRVRRITASAEAA